MGDIRICTFRNIMNDLGDITEHGKCTHNDHTIDVYSWRNSLRHPLTSVSHWGEGVKDYCTNYICVCQNVR